MFLILIFKQAAEKIIFLNLVYVLVLKVDNILQIVHLILYRGRKKKQKKLFLKRDCENLERSYFVDSKPFSKLSYK